MPRHPLTHEPLDRSTKHSGTFRVLYPLHSRPKASRSFAGRTTRFSHRRFLLGPSDCSTAPPIIRGPHDASWLAPWSPAWQAADQAGSGGVPSRHGASRPRHGCGRPQLAGASGGVQATRSGLLARQATGAGVMSRLHEAGPTYIWQLF